MTDTPSHLHVFIKLCLAGAMTSAVYFSMLWGGMHLLVLNYLIAVSIAYFVATIVHFLMNRHFTFKAHEGHQMGQLLRYLLLNLFNYLITLFTVWIAVTYFLLSPYVGSLGAIGLTITANYFLGRYWVFKVHTGEIV
ncbi:MAG: GtrA family protein [bacterium]|nr:GtrA family protein [bacterium]